jgi:hypothetical protein
MNDMLKDPNVIFCAAIIWPSIICAIIYCTMFGKNEYAAKQAHLSSRMAQNKYDDDDDLPEYKYITVADIEKMTLQQMESITKDQLERLPKDIQIIFTREYNKALLAKKQKDNK